MILIGIIAAAAAGKNNAQDASSRETPTTTPERKAMPQSESDARAWIRTLGLDADKVQANLDVVEVQVGLLKRNPTVSGVYRLAQYAQQAHDNLDAIRNDFASTTSDSGTLGNAELSAFSGANDLKNAMGALVAYTGDQNPASLASFTTQYRKARDEWNYGVQAIWRLAHRKKAPTV